MNDVYFFMIKTFPKYISPEYKRKNRSECRKIKDPLSRSIRDCHWRDLFDVSEHPWRCVSRKNEWDRYYEYVIVTDTEGWDDKFIDEAVKDLEVHFYSDYDCTGKVFTSWVHWSRTKVGVVIIRCMSVDV